MEETPTPIKRGRGRPSKPGTPTVNSVPRKKAASKKPEYAEAVLGMTQIAILPLSFKAPEDAFVISEHAPNIANALQDLAYERPEVAAVLDRLMQVGPYGAILTAVLPLTLQLLTNHDVLPAGMLGTIPKKMITEHLRGQAEDLQKDMERYETPQDEPELTDDIPAS